jgi:hypothetical protein
VINSTTEIIPVGTIRDFIRIVTCKRATGNEGDTYRTFLYWKLLDAAKHPKPKSNGMLWTFKRTRGKAVWDGKRWCEIGAPIKPK